MGLAARALLALSLTAACDASQARAHAGLQWRPSSHKPSLRDRRKRRYHGKHKLPRRMKLHNTQDLQYSGTVKVGGQKLKGVLDTGSFELLVFSRECAQCGNQSLLYDHMHSTSYEKGELDIMHSFGSGNTWSHEAADLVVIGSLHAQRQSFWEVVDTVMPVLRSASFQAIVGLGPPGSAVKLAEQQAKQARDARDSLVQLGHPVPDDVAQNVRDFEKAAEHARTHVDLTKNLGVHSFSVCFGPARGDPGYFHWNDVDPSLNSRAFTKIPVVGSIHWSVELTEVRIGPGIPGSKGIIDVGCSTSEAHRGSDGGGSRGPCGAVLDTGTSLIAAPKEAIRQVAKALEELDGDCSKIDTLPELRFNLGGYEYTLPPSSYVGQVIGDIPPALGQFVNFMSDTDPSDNEIVCQPLLMSIDASTQLGPMWILGLPFFRKYYTTFRPSHGEQDGHEVYTAVADDDCLPSHGPSLLESPRKQEVFRINASMIRIPQWATRFV